MPDPTSRLDSLGPLADQRRRSAPRMMSGQFPVRFTRGVTPVAVLLTVAGLQISRGSPSDDSTLTLALGQQAPVF
jgi:hypothetical protein